MQITHVIYNIDLAKTSIQKSEKNINSDMKPYAYAKRYNLWASWNNQNALLPKSDLIVYDAATNHNNNWNSMEKKWAKRITHI